MTSKEAQEYNPKVIDNLLSKELLQLSMRDRNSIDEEIHGVHALAPEETPQKISEALLLLSKDIALLSFLAKKNVPSASYINSSDFRLRFIRCELFDVQKAAVRMMAFIDLCSNLFGTYALHRAIRMSDFTKEEMKMMRCGYVQPLQYRDRSGRPIWSWVGDFRVENGDVRYRVRVYKYGILLWRKNHLKGSHSLLFFLVSTYNILNPPPHPHLSSPIATQQGKTVSLHVFCIIGRCTEPTLGRYSDMLGAIRITQNG